MSKKSSTFKIGLTIEPIIASAQKIPQKAIQKEGILPKHPFSFVISGRSGSGKTCLLLNILTRFLKNYFHETAVFSPTAGELDDTYKALKLPPECFIRHFDEESLNQILECRKHMIQEKGVDWVGKHSRVCLILDDVIADRKFLNSPAALKMFALLRHYHCSVFILTQSYNKVPRALRLNANATAIFPSQQTEIEILKDEIRPPGYSRNEFEELVRHCTEGKYDFLYINQTNGRISKNLDEVQKKNFSFR